MPGFAHTDLSLCFTASQHQRQTGGVLYTEWPDCAFLKKRAFSLPSSELHDFTVVLLQEMTSVREQADWESPVNIRLSPQPLPSGLSHSPAIPWSVFSLRAYGTCAEFLPRLENVLKEKMGVEVTAQHNLFILLSLLQYRVFLSTVEWI